MKTFGRILKFIFIFLYFIALIYLLLFNSYFSELYGISHGISLWAIPLLALISVIVVGYNYIKIYIKVNVIESEFTSIVNHTFRTPLTKIIWALKELKGPEYSKETLLYLQNIENSSTRILNIVDIIAGMQDLDNKSSYFFKPTSLREIIESSIAKYRGVIEEKKFNFQISTFNDIPMLGGDLKKLTFVFDVIVENALYYTNALGDISVGAIVEKDKVIFYVADSGIGLTFMDKFRIFSKFYRSSSARKLYTDGMGLSLYLAKKIVDRHGGRIYAKSKGSNMGATFFVELPL